MNIETKVTPYVDHDKTIRPFRRENGEFLGAAIIVAHTKSDIKKKLECRFYRSGNSFYCCVWFSGSINGQYRQHGAKGSTPVDALRKAIQACGINCRIEYNGELFEFERWSEKFIKFNEYEVEQFLSNLITDIWSVPATTFVTYP